ncbi:MAG: hypothetical protein FJ109_08855 [Deltaproteobacteria bacterium]|nr:hypothetical protein [Deltaproteobacteria bacterium]
MGTWSKLILLVCGVVAVGCGGKDSNPVGTDVRADLGKVEAGAEVCQPNCDGKECGDDGCAGECGVSDVCECIPDCEGKQCGPDGCGGTCGICCPGVPCQYGICLCVPDCKGKECGPDGAGGYCIDGVSGGSCWDPVPDNWGCPEGLLCDFGAGTCVEKTDGSCVLEDGTAKECGSDGAGGTCGSCPCDSCSPDEVYCDLASFQCLSDLAEMDCKWIFDCFDTCPEGDQACYQNCVNSASLPAQMQYNNLIQCLSDSGYFDCFDLYPDGSDEQSGCLEERLAPCQQVYDECFHPGDFCEELKDCFAACPVVPEGQPNPCISDCWTFYVDDNHVVECLDANGYFDCAPDDEKCLSDAEGECLAELNACFPPGILTCKEIFDCMDTCAPTDQACFSTCYQSGTKEAQGEFGAIVDCVMAECGEEPTPECEDTALAGVCAEVHALCMGE